MGKKKTISSRKVSRVSNADRHAQTRATLIKHATLAFTDLGYNDASTVYILEQAQMTRGALYYHFKDKRAIFQAVFENTSQMILDELMAAVDKSIAKKGSALDALVKGSYAFLDAAAAQEHTQIYLVDGPNVLGWQTWREIDQTYCYGALAEGIKIARGKTDHALTLALSGAMNELALSLSQRNKDSITQRQARQTIKAMIEATLQ